jgi:EAL domain-containing protein (putative c-di-GMP-specific phosphodiesterase class I)
VLSLLDRDGSIKAQFQPLLDLRTARIAGFEALSRFGGAPSGDRPPNVWFSQAHRAGLGPRLEAAALSMALSAPGRPTAAFLSLNVSPSTLASDEVREALPEDLTNVVIEITENELVTAAPSLHGTLEELRGRGARSPSTTPAPATPGFTQLLRLRPDIIKLDRELVHGVAGDEYRAALVSSFVRFGRSIDSLICAEGIETLADLRTLADLDVTYGQGYVLAPARQAVARGRRVRRRRLLLGLAGRPARALARPLLRGCRPRARRRAHLRGPRARRGPRGARRGPARPGRRARRAAPARCPTARW